MLASLIHRIARAVGEFMEASTSQRFKDILNNEEVSDEEEDAEGIDDTIAAAGRSETQELALPCFVCGDQKTKEKSTALCSSHTFQSHSICVDCLGAYVESKISSGSLGFCPVISCPAEHSSMDRHTIPYNQWMSLVSEKSLSTYNTLVKSVLTIRCTGCDTNRSCLVDWQEAKEPSETSYKFSQSLGEGFDAQEVHKEFKNYTLGFVEPTVFYKRLLDFYPTIAAGEDIDAWKIFTEILRAVHDPERRASLQLRFFNSRPTIKTPCCNRTHCWRCKAVGHGSRSCQDNLKNLDNTVLQCSNCGIHLVKGDGCDSVRCLCGTSFSWSSMKDKVICENAFAALFKDYEPAFYTAEILLLHPSYTEYHPYFLNDRYSEILRGAKMWREKNSTEVNQWLLRWWNETFASCPAQVAASGAHNNMYGPGYKIARELYTKLNPKKVKRCQDELERTLSTFIHSVWRNEADANTMAAIFSNDSSVQNFLPKSLSTFYQTAARVIGGNEYFRSNVFKQKCVSQCLHQFGNWAPLRLLNLRSYKQVYPLQISSRYQKYQKYRRRYFPNEIKDDEIPAAGDVDKNIYDFFSCVPQCKATFQINMPETTHERMKGFNFCVGICSSHFVVDGKQPFPSLSTVDTSQPELITTADSRGILWNIKDTPSIFDSVRTLLYPEDSQTNEVQSQWIPQNGDIITLSLDMANNFLKVSVEGQGEWIFTDIRNNLCDESLVFAISRAKACSVTLLESEVMNSLGVVNRRQCGDIESLIEYVSWIRDISGDTLPAFVRDLANEYEASTDTTKEEKAVRYFDFKKYYHLNFRRESFSTSQFVIRTMHVLKMNLREYVGLVLWKSSNQEFIESFADREELKELEL